MSDIQWYIQVEVGKKAGPVSFEKIRQLVAEGKIFHETKIRSTEDGAVWTPAKNFDGLFNETSDEMTKIRENIDTSASTDRKAKENQSKSSSIAINIGENPSKSSKTSKSAFIIDVGKSSAKKDKKESNKTEKQDTEPPKSEPSSGGVKITLPGQPSQKAKESSATAQIKIETKPTLEKKGDESTSITVSLDALNAKKKSDASASAININLGKPKEEKKAKDSSAEKKAADIVKSDVPAISPKIDLGTGESKKKSDAPSAAVKIKFGASKKKTEETTEDPVEDSIEDKKSSKKKKEKKETIPKSKKPKDIRHLGVLLSKVLLFISIFLGLGALSVFFVPKQISLTLISCLLAGLGVVVGLSTWLALKQIQDLKEQIEKLSAAQNTELDAQLPIAEQEESIEDEK